MSEALPARGELWEVRFDPSEGDEIKKIRPAVVMSSGTVGRMKLVIVVPVTAWKQHFDKYFWLSLFGTHIEKRADQRIRGRCISSEVTLDWATNPQIG